MRRALRFVPFAVAFTGCNAAAIVADMSGSHQAACAAVLLALLAVPLALLALGD